MRFVVALSCALAVLLTTALPWHWCVPSGESASLVVAGNHAHEEPCDGHDCHHEAPGDRCCEDVPTDPHATPAPASPLVAPIDVREPWLESEPAAAFQPAYVALPGPVPRVPTETVVLLR